MDSRTDRSNAQRPLLMGALVLAALFVAAGAAVCWVGGERTADACRRDVEGQMRDTRRRAAIDEAADRAAAVRAVFDGARRLADSLARETQRAIAADAAEEPAEHADVAAPAYAYLGERAEVWTRAAEPGTYAVTLEQGSRQQGELSRWARRLGPILRNAVGADAGIEQASVSFGGLGSVGAPAAWPMSAETDAVVAASLTHDVEEWAATVGPSWDTLTADPTYAVPVTLADGTRVGAVRVRLSRAALTSMLASELPIDAWSGAALLTENGGVAAWTPALAATLGLAKSATDDDVRSALQPAVGGKGLYQPPAGGSHAQLRGQQFGAMRVAGAPYSVAVVVPGDRAAVVAPPSAIAARRFGYTVVALCVALGLVVVLAAFHAAKVHARRVRPVLEAIHAHEAGDYTFTADVAGDDDTADVARWLNTAALRLRIALMRSEESERRIADLIAASADGFVTTDADDRITQVNSRFAELLHMPEKSLVGRFVEELLLPDSVERWRNHRRRVDARPARFDVAWQGGRRSHPRTLVSCVPLLNDDGLVIGRYFVVTDMTDRVRVHEEVARAEKVRALGEMAGGVAHDFNNLLTVILGNAQFLLLEDHPAEVQQTLKVIERAALEGTETVRRIREFAKPRAISVNADLVSPNEVVAAVMDEARRRFAAEGLARGVAFNVRVERRSCRKLRGNAAELREALANIVENALDAMPRGGSLTVESFDRGEDAIAIRIEDTGVGMTPEQAAKVFDPFYTTKPGGRCPGLGLSIAFGIVRAHRGQIDLRSSPGNGATFTIVLPAAAAAAVEPSSEPITGSGLVRVAPRVLLVGGEVGGMQPFLDELRSLGVYATSVHPAAAPPLVAETGIFNTLVIDFDLGATSGWEMARQARAKREDLRIVLLTTPANPVSETQARNAGIDRVLVRPFTVRDLHAEVFALLASPRERAEAPAPASVRNRAAPSIRLRDTSGDVAQVCEIWGSDAVRPTSVATRTRTTSETGDDVPVSESASALTVLDAGPADGAPAEPELPPSTDPPQP